MPGERSIHTESFDDFPGESTVTTVLVETGGTTTLTATVLYPSREIRDAVIQSGMEHGAAESYDKLAELLANENVNKSMRVITKQRPPAFGTLRHASETQDHRRLPRRPER